MFIFPTLPASGQLIEKEMDGGPSAVPGHDEISSVLPLRND